MPLPLSVTAPSVPVAEPPPNPKVTTCPPLGSWLPAASRAISVTVEVLPDWMLAGATTTVEAARL